MDDIYAPPTKCLGDCWAFVNMLCDISIRSGREVLCSTYVCGRHGEGIHKSLSVKDKLLEIMSVLDMGDADIRLVDRGATVFTPDVTCFKHPYRPTKRRWAGGNLIVHQLSNNQQPEQCIRCLLPHRRDVIMDWISRRENARLGLPLSMGESIRLASRAALFVGIDSGMSHVCHSVGVPVIIYDWPRINDFHNGKEFKKFSTPEEAIKLMSSYV